MQLKFHIYLGPQELQQITRIQPEWSGVMYYGTFDFIAHMLLHLLDFVFSLVHNWGITIVILSVLIYLILFPLTLKQMRSMKQMQALQPRIEELRRVYKDNPQKLNTEIMALYKEYKVNPFSGCLPLVLQMPIFFALYQVLLRSVAFKGAQFLWIKDLSLPDRLFTLPVSVPVLGNEINLLPILMTIGMFVQQKTSMAAASTGSAEQQKLMMILFPLMFGFIFYRMPSGLVLYWFINSALMLFYQIKINKQK
jgi:YidC/Oxa1 family membrane protein insertase